VRGGRAQARLSPPPLRRRLVIGALWRRAARVSMLQRSNFFVQGAAPNSKLAAPPSCGCQGCPASRGAHHHAPTPSKRRWIAACMATPSLFLLGYTGHAPPVLKHSTLSLCRSTPLVARAHTFPGQQCRWLVLYSYLITAYCHGAPPVFIQPSLRCTLCQKICSPVPLGAGLPWAACSGRVPAA
jgi:hypothetical protein